MKAINSIFRVKEITIYTIYYILHTFHINMGRQMEVSSTFLCIFFSVLYKLMTKLAMISGNKRISLFVCNSVFSKIGKSKISNSDQSEAISFAKSIHYNSMNSATIDTATGYLRVGHSIMYVLILAGNEYTIHTVNNS